MKKKLITLLLAASMIVSTLSGCGNSSSGGGSDKPAAETGNETGNETGTAEAADAADSVLKDGDMAEILMIWPGSNASPASMQEVEDAMNEIIAPVADAKVKLQIIEWGAYGDQINLMLSSGEKMDIFMQSDGIREEGQRGQLYDVSDMIKTYAPEAYQAMERYIDACYFDGALFSLASVMQIS